MNMNKEIEIKISLMESIKVPDLEKGGKGEYIVRSSAKYNPQEYFKNNYRDLTSDEDLNGELFEKFLASSMDLVFQELKDKTKQQVDSVGIWIQKGPEILENSMNLEFLEAMNQYGNDDIIPIYEFYKMTLQKYDASLVG